MNTALDVFRANLARVRAMHALHLHFSSLVTKLGETIFKLVA
jgi:hypothetical protein